MSMSRNLMLASVLVSASAAVHAQSALTNGAEVVVPATGEMSVPNDEAHATLQVEEQDKDKAVAASRVNQKMKQGMEILKRQDPQAVLKSYGYYTYAVYANEPATPSRNPKARQIVGWRVGQYVEMITGNLATLPKTIASVQSTLGLNGLHFGLSPATSKKLDASLIELTYKNLDERIGFIARAMHRSPSEAVVTTVDFEGSGNYVSEQVGAAPKAARMNAMADYAPSEQVVSEPSFEPGESTVTMRMVGKIRFK
ncbi:SIMPL domain-containing protein [Herbaspirillum lusitanum]|uniref:SIMPL domain-containing protein n=1 Tax=Herbaspirillum lusitanum TaxID=213312 RepID=A0ABW9A450_9BURK